MIDNHTIVIYGWKIEGNDEVRKIGKKLEKVDEEYWDKFGRIQLIRLKKDRMDVNIFTDWIWRKLHV